MLANEARKIASEKIWNSLPRIIRYNIEDAINEGKLNCEIFFHEDNEYEFNECINYFQDLKELGYEAAMHKTYSNFEMYYVITIIW